MSHARWVRCGACAALVLGAALVAGACGRKTTAPVPPGAQLGPEVEAVFPAARSTRVVATTDIWVRFRAALDPATVNDRTVFFKIDTRRIPAAISYDSTTRTIHITPTAPLTLKRTHTVELTPGLATAGGGHFGGTYFWQFTTSSVRVPSAPFPDPGAGNESPVSMLGWSGTEAAAGLVVHQIYVSTDSAAVAAKLVPARSARVHNYFLPATPWPFETRLYWSVTTLNTETMEEVDGPVWSFTTLPADTPVDSLSMAPVRWGYYDNRFVPGRRVCLGNLTSGEDWTCVIRWPVETLPATMRFARAVVVMSPSFPTSNLPARQPSLWATHEAFTDCESLGWPGPPYLDGLIGALANGEEILVDGLTRLRFSSTLFASHLEGIVRGRGVAGYQLRSSQPVNYSRSNRTIQDLKIYYYVLPPSAVRP